MGFRLFGGKGGTEALTAQEAEALAREKLASWPGAASAYLCDISVEVAEPIEADGTTRRWFVHYYSPQDKAVLEVYVSKGKGKGPKRLKGEEIGTRWSLYRLSPPPEPIPSGWIDSSQAVRVALEVAEREVQPRVGRDWDDYHIQVLGLPAAHCALLSGGGALLSRPGEPRLRAPAPSQLCWIVILGHIDIDVHPSFAYYMDAASAEVLAREEFTFA